MQTNNALYIGNLDDSTSTENLYAHFHRYNIVNIHHPYDHDKKRNKNFAFISFESAEDAVKARQEQNNQKMGNNHIRLMPVLPKSSFNKTESNIFIKNLDPSITYQEFDVKFRQFGQVLTSFLKTDKNGESLGYGYVQYSEKQGAENAIKQAHLQMFKDKQMQVVVFKSKKLRSNVNQKCNVYFKQMPLEDKSEAGIKALETKMHQVFTQFGQITSLMVKIDAKVGRPFGFVCFDTHENAQNALTRLNEQDVFNTGEAFYVSWAQTRSERKRQMNEAGDANNETKIYVRDLKLDVTEEQLKEVFEQFGTISTLSVKQVKVGENDKKFGMIDYNTKEEAATALASGKHQEVRALTLDPNHITYIKLAQSKQVRERYNRMRRKQHGDKQLAKMFGQGSFGGMNRRSMPQMQLFMQNYPMMMAMMQMMMGGMGGGGANMAQMMQQMKFQGQNRGGYNQMRRQGGQYQRRNMNQQRRQYNPQQTRGGQGQGFQQQYQKQMRQPRVQNMQQQQRGPQVQHQMQQQMQGQKMMQNMQGNQMQQQQQNLQQMQMNKMKQQQQGGERQPMPQQGGMRQGMKQMQGQKDQALQHARQKISALKSRIGDFKKMVVNEQRNILGEILFPIVNVYVQNPQNTPKITGMLIDASVMTVENILLMLEDFAKIQRKVQEAERLIQTPQHH